MFKPFDWLWNLVPNGYKWDVAIRKVSYTIAKFGIGFLAASAAGKHIDPKDLAVVEGVVGATVAGGLTWLHDWAHMKWPDKKWLAT